MLTVMRYVERNALRAGLVQRAEAWRWSSLWQRLQRRPSSLLDDGPVALPEDWKRRVNEAEHAALRQSVKRGSPFGATPWLEKTVTCLELESTVRSRGRPHKPPVAGAK